MGRKEKLLQRLFSRPKDFTWRELETLLKFFGYRLAKPGKAGGSRRRFVHEDYPPISLLKPHPKEILKLYQIDIVLQILTDEGLL